MVYGRQGEFMEFEHVYAIIGVIIGFMTIIITLGIWAINKLDGDIKSLSVDIKSMGTRLDGHVTRLDGHAMRIDQLYHMFIDLVKEGRK